MLVTKYDFFSSNFKPFRNREVKVRNEKNKNAKFQLLTSHLFPPHGVRSDRVRLVGWLVCQLTSVRSILSQRLKGKDMERSDQRKSVTSHYMSPEFEDAEVNRERWTTE
jgi:hypothetical protein